MTRDNCGEWHAVNLYRVTYIEDGERITCTYAGAAKAQAQLLRLLKHDIPAWCEEIESLDDSIPF
tara:strand:- start:236 stop:430 length:195 start_codon:yes stop_codon:yes gene_type:complete